MAAGKVLLVLGLGAAALALAGGTAHAESAGGDVPHPGGDTDNPPPDVVQLVTQAAASGNPALMRSTADQLDKLGFHKQATGLRTLAAAVEAAQKGAPPPPGVPPLPGVQPAGPPPGAQAPSGADALAAKLTAQLLLTDPIVNGRTPANSQTDLVTAFQAQEKAKGNLAGNPDGLYGPGSALAVANYGIVPYPPFFWSKNPNTTRKQKAAFKAAMMKKAAADPSRADEWSHVANQAQNT